MEPFPTRLELEVAEVLLLLSSSSSPSLSPHILSLPPPLPSRICVSSDSFKACESSKGSFIMSDSNFKSSCCSSVASDGSSRAIRAKRLFITDVVAPCHDLKLQIAKKNRSKNYRISDCRKLNSGEMWKKYGVYNFESESPESSCLSSTSTAISSARSRFKKEAALIRNKQQQPQQFCSGHLRRRAEAILRFLTRGGSASEVRIRQVLGDSPDTSKALRMLLRLEKVKRSGTGGRQDPFIYLVA